MGVYTKPKDPEITELLKRSASRNSEVRAQANRELAQGLEDVLREGTLVGDVLDNIYEQPVIEGESTPEFPLDIVSPGEEDQFIAFTQPMQGRIPEKEVTSDFVRVPTFGVSNAVDWQLRHAELARFDIVARSMQVFEAGFAKKKNDDGWHVLLSAAADRNIGVFDSDATQGFFTKRLVSLMKTVMVRNAGGNTGSVRRGRLTDLYLSHEALEDVRNWGVDQIDEVTRREIFQASDDSDVITRIFGVNLHPLDEFGEGQEYQDFFTSDLGASLEGSDVELVIGLDLTNRDSFILPVTKELEVFDDNNLHRRQKAGVYGWQNYGVAALDSRRVITGSF